MMCNRNSINENDFKTTLTKEIISDLSKRFSRNSKLLDPEEKIVENISNNLKFKTVNKIEKKENLLKKLDFKLISDEKFKNSTLTRNKINLDKKELQTVRFNYRRQKSDYKIKKIIFPDKAIKKDSKKRVSLNEDVFLERNAIRNEDEYVKKYLIPPILNEVPKRFHRDDNKRIQSVKLSELIPDTKEVNFERKGYKIDVITTKDHNVIYKFIRESTKPITSMKSSLFQPIASNLSRIGKHSTESKLKDDINHSIKSPGFSTLRYNLEYDPENILRKKSLVDLKRGNMMKLKKIESRIDKQIELLDIVQDNLKKSFNNVLDKIYQSEIEKIANDDC